jgi:aryl-alcohol dehydrogenase-like predicted oxidoreductase
MGWSRFIGVQAPYSLLSRDLEREIMPVARHHEMAVLTWGILSAGVLTGKFLTDVNEPTRQNPDNVQKMSDERVAIVREVVNIADEVGKPPAQVAINWVRQQQHRAQVIPILGARKIEQMKDNIECLDWSLEQEHLDRLDKVSEINLGFPFNFAYQNDFVYGETYKMIDFRDSMRQIPPVRAEAR